MKRRFILIMFCMAILLTMQFAYAPEAMAEDVTDNTLLFDNIDYQKSTDIRVIVDGEQLIFDVNPQIVDGRTLVPMRTMFEKFGLTVSWDDVNKKAQGTSADISIVFTIGSNVALVNNEEKSLDVPASIIGESTMIPLRFLSENMGYNVVWVDSSNLILISKSDIIEWRYEGYESIDPYKEYEIKYINGIKTAETRYNGKNHEVNIITLYSKDGRIVPNVPEFNIDHYGAGWYKQSPFVGNTYWVDIDNVGGLNKNSEFYDMNDFSAIDSVTLRNSAFTGNYIKVTVEDHFFDLDTWNKMDDTFYRKYSEILDEKLLDGTEINNYSTIFKVTINDKYSGLIFLGNLIDPLLAPDGDEIYVIFQKDPRTIFDWSDSIWTKLKGETPWVGMTQDMLLVLMQNRPNEINEAKTRFSVFELWVYEYDYVDSVYFFSDGILTLML